MAARGQRHPCRIRFHRTPDRTRSVLVFGVRTSAGRNAHLGLGLAYAKRLIEINGGRIAIESHPRVGTTVTCYLPLAV
jgi:signal transduction histidine kinase